MREDFRDTQKTPVAITNRSINCPRKAIRSIRRLSPSPRRPRGASQLPSRPLKNEETQLDLGLSRFGFQEARRRYVYFPSAATIILSNASTARARLCRVLRRTPASPVNLTTGTTPRLFALRGLNSREDLVRIPRLYVLRVYRS